MYYFYTLYCHVWRFSSWRKLKKSLSRAGDGNNDDDEESNEETRQNKFYPEANILWYMGEQEKYRYSMCTI